MFMIVIYLVMDVPDFALAPSILDVAHKTLIAPQAVLDIQDILMQESLLYNMALRILGTLRLFCHPLLFFSTSIVFLRKDDQIKKSPKTISPPPNGHLTCVKSK